MLHEAWLGGDFWHGERASHTSWVSSKRREERGERNGKLAAPSSGSIADEADTQVLKVRNVALLIGGSPEAMGMGKHELQYETIKAPVSLQPLAAITMQYLVII